MKRFFIVAFLAAVSSVTAYSQVAALAEKISFFTIMGKAVKLDQNGEFTTTGFGDRIVKGTYDEEGSTITSMTYYERNGMKTHGIVTVCNKINYTNSDVAYCNASESNSRKEKTTTVYFDVKSSKKDYIEICGDYSELIRATFTDGVMEGDYYYYNRTHGGNCDWKETITGEYENNKKEGKWIKSETLDCSHTLNTWFEGMNGSYEQDIITYYKNGQVVLGPTTYEK